MDATLARMRDHVFFEGPEARRKLGRFWLLLPLSAVIASAGVVGDSTATVIGAMIVAPLMVPILGTVLAVVLGDRANALRSVGLVVSGAACVVAIGYVTGLLHFNTVVAGTNSQVAARVSPRLIDLLAALATGAVGAIALARDDIADTLPGVAIAISLVPPLAVVGLTLESGAPDEAAGALLLFATNVTAILASGLAVMGVFHIQRLAGQPESSARDRARRRRAVTAIGGGLVVIALLLSLNSVSLTLQTARTTTVGDAAREWAAPSGWEVQAVEVRTAEILVRATGPQPAPDPAALRAALDRRGLNRVAVRLELVPADVRRI